jgi:AraC-like DNA-binding protein
MAQLGSFEEKQASIGVEAYDAARWTHWVPTIVDTHADCELSSLRQVTPSGAAEANVTKAPPNNSHVVLFWASGSRRLECSIGGAPARAHASAWQWTYIPAGVDSVWKSTPAAAHDVFHLHLDNTRFRSVLTEGSLEAIDPDPIVLGTDFGLGAIGRMALADVREGCPPDRLAWSSYAALLALRLPRLSHGLGASPQLRALVCDWRLRRAIEYLEARIAERVSLDELAAQVDLSQSHLVTLLRSGAGEPPHRWLMLRRIERACQMLAETRLSITKIALACGFASSQHFATTFRKHKGATPSQFRAEGSN